MHRISQLILLHVTGRISDAEAAELERWAAESDDNRRLLDRLTDGGQLSEALDVWQMADSTRPCADMQQRVDAITRPRRLLRYAAAAAVAAVAGTALWLMSGTPSLDNTGTSVPLAVIADTTGIEEIRHGVTRALLSDASGRSVLLNEADTATVSTALLHVPVEEAPERNLCLEVPRGGEFKVLLEDGTEVWLNSDSRLYYPQSFGSEVRRVSLEGEAFFHVATDSLRPFYVETGSQQVRVYGTSFNVRYYPENPEIYTTLVEGMVAITRSTAGSGALFLTPGHQSVFTLADEMVSVKPVDTEVVTSWRNGRFVFENQTLLRIMQDLSRWYDFDYEFTDPSLRQEEFMGSIPRYADFTTAIAILEKCGGIQFAIADGKVVIGRSNS